MQKQSYDSSSYSSFDEEKKRLSRQAALFREQEIALLIRQGIQPGHWVLDLGCGNGETAAMLSDYLCEGSITGIDINPDFIASANQQYTAPNLVYLPGSAYDLEGLPNFNFIYSRLLFQHLSNPSLALQQIFDHLEPGGQCCIIDVHDDWLSLQPSIPAFDSLVNAGIDKQRAAGGNRRVAGILPTLMQSKGFVNINIEIVPFSSLQTGIEVFLDITVSFRANMAPELTPLYLQIQETVRANPDKWFGVMGVFVITASKPTV